MRRNPPDKAGPYILGKEANRLNITMNIIIIAGMPASGKTTFANKLSAVLHYPVLEKDAIKEELFDVIGFKSYAEKRLMDIAATSVLLRCTEALLVGGQSVIVVNNFPKDTARRVEKILEKYDCSCVLVFFGGSSDVFYQRYVERDRIPRRHLGHILQDRYPPLPGDPQVYTMSREEFAEKFEKLGINDFQITQGVRINVDATHPEKLDDKTLIQRICSCLKI